jgi:hypothetical protein
VRVRGRGRVRRQECKRAREQERKRAREQESKRAREQESKRAREQESKRARGQKYQGARVQGCERFRTKECKSARVQDCKTARLCQIANVEECESRGVGLPSCRGTTKQVCQCAIALGASDARMLASSTITSTKREPRSTASARKDAQGYLAKQSREHDQVWGVASERKGAWQENQESQECKSRCGEPRTSRTARSPLACSWPGCVSARA